MSDLGLQDKKADLISQMSFKTHDSQTIVTVLSQSKSIFNEAKKADFDNAKPSAANQPAGPSNKKKSESDSRRSIGLLSQGSGSLAEKVVKKLIKPTIKIPDKPKISELKSDEGEPSGRIMLKSDAPQLGVS